MPIFRVERTELRTRVWWEVKASTKDEALETFMKQDEDTSYYTGEPTITIEEVKFARGCRERSILKG